MPQPLVKICGITRAADAAAAVAAGADILGLNFFRGPRKIDYRCVADLALPAGVLTVGLAAYPAPNDQTLAAITAATGIATFQLYAAPYPAVPAHGACSVWLVAGIDSRESLQQIAPLLRALHWQPAAIVLDSRTPGQVGGTGQIFDWNWIVDARAAGELAGLPPLVLAGGLTPDNVAAAVRLVQPWAVDVSSGVEVPGQPGIKDAIKLRDFIAAAKS